jgi:hypothetical protein
MIQKFLSLFKSKPKHDDLNRRTVKDVVPGENIQIEWHRIAGGIGYVKCINNDPKTKKILIEVTWNNWKEAKSQKTERTVFNYSDIELSNFYLLNPEIEDGEKDNTIKK